MSYRIIDLFSGAGGLTQGFIEVGDDAFKPVFALDNNEAAIATYNENFGGHGIVADIEKWVKGDVPEADLVIGGPPCQGFSLLNKKRTGDERRALWEPFLETVQKSGAIAFVMENVAQLAKSPELDDIKAQAERIGFQTVVGVLNAADYGAPQVRRRTFVLGWNTSMFVEGLSLPKPSHASPKEESSLPPWRTVHDAIADLPPAPIGTEIGDDPVLGLHFGRNPTKLSQMRYRHVPEGGNRFDLQRNAEHLTPACWIRKKSGGTDLFGRLWWDRPSVTIRTEFFKPEKGRYLHPIEHRPITHREAARLMGFEDTFEFRGSKIEIAKQIGNAVPPDLARAIARAVLVAFNSREKSTNAEENQSSRAA
ncbi:DNA cytosine methyltransferase [Thalassobius sp. MITS945101]|uniref:DNA cytosine methyltransferase n=1 Tax=Thalassobius sp. MITS945101 TaxID=3096994 RepID=UPI00399A2354